MTTSTTAKPEASGVRSLARAARPVTAAELARLRELHGAGLSCRQIAKEMNRAPVTISRHASALGLSFDRSQVKEATAARSADLEAVRVLVSGQFLMLSEKLNHRVMKLLDDGDPEEIKAWHIRDFARASTEWFQAHLAQAAFDHKDERDYSDVDAWLAAMHGEEPPRSRSEADQTAKLKSVLGGLMDTMLAKYPDDSYQRPEI